MGSNSAAWLEAVRDEYANKSYEAVTAAVVQAKGFVEHAPEPSDVEVEERQDAVKVQWDFGSFYVRIYFGVDGIEDLLIEGAFMQNLDAKHKADAAELIKLLLARPELETGDVDS